MTDPTPRDYTIYVEYDARIMWRDDEDRTGQIGPTFHSHDADQLVVDRLEKFRDGLAADEFKPSEVSGRSFVVPLGDDDARRVKAGKVAVTRDGVEAGGTGVPDEEPKPKKGKTGTDDRPALVSDEERAREPNRKVTADR